MSYFNKLSNSVRYPLGMEWPLLKKMPWIFTIGTILIIMPMAHIYLTNAIITAAQYKTIYICLGVLFSYWFFVGVTTIGCVLIIIMKGPGYVADGYELPKEDKRLEERI